MTNDAFFAKTTAAFNTSVMEVSVKIKERSKPAISRPCVADYVSKY